MNNAQQGVRTRIAQQCVTTGCLILIFAVSPIVSFAQPAPLSPPQLDQLVARIALYPDPLLANILTASTYWTEIPEAAAWADQHSYLKGDALAQAMQADHLQWDPSIMALLPFPSVLDMMARDPAWTQQLGNAVLTQDADVMDAVQRMRQRAMSYGYLTPNGYMNVTLERRLYSDSSRRSKCDLRALLRSCCRLRTTAAWLRDWGSDPLRSGDHHWCGIRWMGMVAWLRICLAFSHHPDRSPSMGPRVGQSIRIHSPLCASLGATGWAARGGTSF